MIQVMLALFGLTAMYMAMGNHGKQRKYAPIVGLCGQPFWMIFAFQAEAWGLALLTVAWSAVYVRGIYVQWRA